VYTKTKNRIYLPIIGLGVLGILMSQSRTAWGFTIVILLVLGTIHRQAIHQYIGRHTKVVLYGILAMLAIGFFASSRIRTLQYTFSGGSGAIRRAMIEEGTQVLQQNLWIGHGIHTGVRLLYEYFPGGYIQDFPFDIHMGYLQMALESGVLGVLFFFFPFLIALRGSILMATNKRGSNMFPITHILCFGTIFLYYVLQPHGGRLEIPLLGIILGLYTTSAYEQAI
jgi:hypothetical protein